MATGYSPTANTLSIVREMYTAAAIAGFAASIFIVAAARFSYFVIRWSSAGRQ